MPECLLVPNGPFRECVVCNERVPAGTKPYHRQCDGAPRTLLAMTKRARVECRYLGDQIGEKEEECCGGVRMVPLMACAHENHKEGTTALGCGYCPDAHARDRKILFRMRRGLGDTIQFGVVLRHVRAAFPGWQLHLECDWGKGAALKLAGLLDGLWRPDEAIRAGAYDITLCLDWPDCGRSWAKHPSTKAEQCIIELIGIPVRPELCSYVAGTRAELVESMRKLLGPRPLALIHFQGASFQESKNLDPNVVRHVAMELLRRGRRVFILDAERRYGLPTDEGYELIAQDSPIWQGYYDSGSLASLASLAEVCIGIDSGPGKIFSALCPKTIIVWQDDLHPIHYHDHSRNALHFIPAHHERYVRGPEKEAALAYFYEHYRWRQYGKRLGFELADAIAELCPLAEGKDSGERPLVVEEGWHVREWNKAGDLAIVEHVYHKDEYRLEWLPDLAPGSVIVDVGAHIGTFAAAAHRRWPAARILCFEAIAENAELCRRNVGHFAEVYHATVSGEPDGQLWSCLTPGHAGSTGGSCYLPKGEKPDQLGYAYHPVEGGKVISLGGIMGLAGGQVACLKLDCEGSEYSILNNELPGVGFVIAEVHGGPRWARFRREKMPDWIPKKLWREAKQAAGPMHLWRRQVAKRKAYRASGPVFAVPGGVGDCLWSMTKVRALLEEYRAEKCEIAVLGGGPPFRSVPFLERFRFVSRAFYENPSRCSSHVNKDGTYHYYPTQSNYLGKFDEYLVANEHLEHGRRLEDWRPELATDWLVANCFKFKGEELAKANAIKQTHGQYVTLYLGPKEGNAKGSGHNRNELWSKADWGLLAHGFRKRGYAVLVIGAEYDRPYFEDCKGWLGPVKDFIGQWHIGQTFAVMQRAAANVAYQSGLAIFGAFLGCNVASWWRPADDSRDPDRLSSFDERMAHCWCPWDALESGRYLPGIYGRTVPEEILHHADRFWFHAKKRHHATAAQDQEYC